MFGTVLLVLTLSNARTTADIARAIPFSESFELFGVDTPVTPAQGWYPDAADPATVVATNYDARFWSVRPLDDTNVPPAVPHAKVLRIHSAAACRVTNTLGATTLWMDMMIQAHPHRFGPPPEPPSDARFALYFNSNGQAMVYASWYPGGFALDRGWLEMRHAPVAPDEWVRLTVETTVEVLEAGYHDMFRARLNNSEWLTHPLGIMEPDRVDLTNGMWFFMVRAGEVFPMVKSLAYSGSGYLDDLVVTDRDPGLLPMRLIAIDADPGACVFPSNTVAVRDGGRASFAISECEGYDLVDVVLSGAGGATHLGPTGLCEFAGLRTNATLRVITRPEPRFLTVALSARSELGEPFPPPGRHTRFYGERIDALIAGEPLSTATARHWCTWHRTGSGDASGEGTQTAFAISGVSTSAETILTWDWRLQYALALGTQGWGTVASTAAWYDAGTETLLTARPGQDFEFDRWDGDCPENLRATNPVVLTMDRARAVAAVFRPTSQRTALGTPHRWLDVYQIANRDDALDHDGDGLPTWAEYLAGTDPTDPRSAFAVLAVDRAGGSNCVVWHGTSNGWPLSYGMLVSTNLGGTWEWRDTRLPRDPDGTGTNRWWDTNGWPGPAFYRPSARRVDP